MKFLRRLYWRLSLFMVRQLRKGMKWIIKEEDVDDIVINHIAKTMDKSYSTKMWKKLADRKIATALLTPIVSKKPYKLPRTYGSARKSIMVDITNHMRFCQTLRLFRTNKTIEVKMKEVDQSIDKKHATSDAN